MIKAIMFRLDRFPGWRISGGQIFNLPKMKDQMIPFITTKR